MPWMRRTAIEPEENRRKEGTAVIDHRRFSIPSETPSRSSVAAVPPMLNQHPQAAMSPMEMLARLYAMAYEQARASVAQRQWEELLERLFNSPA